MSKCICEKTKIYYDNFLKIWRCKKCKSRVDEPTIECSYCHQPIKNSEVVWEKVDWFRGNDEPCHKKCLT